MASEKLSMGRKMKKKKEREIKHHDKRNHELCENDEKSNKLEGNEKYKPTDEKKRKREKRRNHNIGEAVQTHVKVGNSIIEAKENYRSKSVRKRKSKLKCGTLDGISDQLGTNTEDGLHEQNDGVAHNSQLSKIENSREADDETEIRTRKSEKARKKKKIDPDTSMEDEKLPEKTTEAVYHLSSGDEDCSKGMKKWVTEYYQSRPGLKELQQRIDEFITAHEAQLEQERKEREAKAAEGGWTVVVHHKGRKKTTDSESGITVGSVAQAVVEDKMAKKKHKDVGLDFYRFQRREARRNEILMLQSKFEQDRKRIQQLRAARKFQPY